MKKGVLLFILFFWLVTAPFAHAQAPQLEITSPQEGEVITNNYVVFSFKVQNFVLRDYHLTPPPQAGEGHLHLCLDREFADMDDPSCREHIFLNDEIFTGLKSGDHFISAELIGNDHQPFSPAIRKVVNFKVVRPETPVSPTPVPAFGSLLKNKRFYLILLGLVVLVGFSLIGTSLWLSKKKQDKNA